MGAPPGKIGVVFFNESWSIFSIQGRCHADNLAVGLWSLGFDDKIAGRVCCFFFTQATENIWNKNIQKHATTMNHWKNLKKQLKTYEHMTEYVFILCFSRMTGNNAGIVGIDKLCFFHLDQDLYAFILMWGRSTTSTHIQRGWVMLKGGMCEMPKYALIYAASWRDVNGVFDMIVWKKDGFELFWMILRLFLEVCSWEWFNTIPRFFCLSLSS